MAGASGIRAGRAFVELATRDKLTAGLKKAQRQLRAFGNYANQVGRSISAAGLIAGAGFAISTKALVNFDDRMRQVRAVTGASAHDFERLTAEARRLGAATSYSASEVAALMTELGRAGFKPQEIIDSTEAVLALAKATSTELPRAGEIAGAALRAFGKDASEMPKVVDILTATANGSAQTLEDLFEAMKPLAPIASSAGETMESTAAAIGVLANNGIKGSLAGNALARAYKNLSTEAGQADLRQIGVDAVDAAGNLRPMADIINDIARATAGMPSAKRLAIFESLFGRGQAAALKLAESGEAFDTLREQIEGSSGIAVRTAEQMEAGLGGSFRRILSAAESVAISVGRAIEKPMQLASGLVLKAAGSIDTFVQSHQGLVAALAVGTAVAITAGFALLGVGTMALLASFALGTMASVVGLLGSVMTAALSPIGLVVLGVAGLGTAIILWSGKGAAALRFLGAAFGGLLERWRPVIDAIRSSMVEGDITSAARVLWAALAVEWERGAAALTVIWAAGKAKMLTSLSEMWHGAQAGFEIGLHAIESAWHNSLTFMLKFLDRFGGWVRKKWNGITSEISKLMLDVQGLFDSDLDVGAAKAVIDAGDKAFNEQVDSEVDSSIDDRDEALRERQRRNEERHQETMRQIIEDANAARDKYGGEAADRIASAGEALLKAKEELDAAIAAAGGGDTEDGGPEGPGITGKIAGAIDDMLAGLSGAAQNGLSSRGTFSATAAGDLGRRPLDELVELNKGIERHTKKIANNSEAGGLAFS